jgi:hypothetical protein
METPVAQNPMFAVTWEELQEKMGALLTAAHHGDKAEVRERIRLIEAALDRLRRLAQPVQG